MACNVYNFFDQIYSESNQICQIWVSWKPNFWVESIQNVAGMPFKAINHLTLLLQGNNKLTHMKRIEPKALVILHNLNLQLTHYTMKAFNIPQRISVL